MSLPKPHRHLRRPMMRHQLMPDRHLRRQQQQGIQPTMTQHVGFHRSTHLTNTPSSNSYLFQKLFAQQKENLVSYWKYTLLPLEQ
jgi:hypothetical protein